MVCVRWLNSAAGGGYSSGSTAGRCSISGGDCSIWVRDSESRAGEGSLSGTAGWGRWRLDSDLVHLEIEQAVIRVVPDPAVPRSLGRLIDPTADRHRGAPVGKELNRRCSGRPGSSGDPRLQGSCRLLWGSWGLFLRRLREPPGHELFHGGKMRENQGLLERGPPRQGSPRNQLFVPTN